VVASVFTKLAVAANAGADSGAITTMTQETTIIVANVTFLIWAEPDERAKNCVIWDNPFRNYYAVIITIYI
jgi:hypothetical protein